MVTYIHRRMILKTILRGDVTTNIDGLRFPMSPGDSVLFFPFQFHSTEEHSATSKHDFIAVSFIVPEKGYLPLLPLKNRCFRLLPEDWNSLNHLADAFWRQGGTTPSEAILELSSILVRHIVRHSDGKIPPPQDGDDHFTQICNYIRENFMKQISLKSVSRHFGLSPESIRRMFQRHYPGLTPARLIRKLQLQNAVELLECTDMPVGAVSDQCGFSDTFTFSKKFKQMTGLSPRAYRLRSQTGAAR
jgi:AraC-like DNA-binding protein